MSLQKNVDGTSSPQTGATETDPKCYTKQEERHKVAKFTIPVVASVNAQIMHRSSPYPFQSENEQPLNRSSSCRLRSVLRQILQFGCRGRLLRDSLLDSGDDSLQLLEATILLFDLATESLNFMVQVDTVLVRARQTWEVSDGWRGVTALHSSRRKGGGTDALDTVEFGGAIPTHINHGRSFIIMHVAATEMFPQVLLARETVAGAAVAVGVWAHQGLLGVCVFLVDFALVAQETTGVGETLDLVAVGFKTFVRTIMFVHVFAKSALVFGASRDEIIEDCTYFHSHGRRKVGGAD
jgi:hypothetical protein